MTIVLSCIKNDIIVFSFFMNMIMETNF